MSIIDLGSGPNTGGDPARYSFAINAVFGRGTVEARQSTPPTGLTDASDDVQRAWIVEATASGDWAGAEGKVAIWLGTAPGWRLVTAPKGWVAYVQDEDLEIRADGADGWTVATIGTIADGSLPPAKLEDAAAATVVGRDAEDGSGAPGYLTAAQLIEVLNTATGLSTDVLGPGKFALNRIADIATGSLLGRTASGAGPVQVLTPAQVRAIIGVEAGATADQTATEIADAIDADATAEATLSAALGVPTAAGDIGAAPASHTHTLADVTDAGTAAAHDVPSAGNASGDQVVLATDTRLSDARAPTAHGHLAGDITGLATVATSGSYNDLSDLPTLGTAASSDAADFIASTRTIATGTGLTGGGDLSADRTIALQNTGVTPGSYGAADTVPTYTVDAQGRLAAASDVPIAITAGAVSGLATVATSGSYNDLSDLPTLGTAATTDATDYATAAQGAAADSAVQPGDLAAVATSGSAADLTTGTLHDGRLSANIPRLDQDADFQHNIFGSRIHAGYGDGAVSLTTNDGGGNANVCFNHDGGVADSDGSSARITANVDSPGAGLLFWLGDNAIAGQETAITATLTMKTSWARFDVDVGVGKIPSEALDVVGNIRADGFITNAYTVSTLPSGTEAALAYASDGRKNGETAGNGTGVAVFYDGSNWIAVDSGQTVAA